MSIVIITFHSIQASLLFFDSQFVIFKPVIRMFDYQQWYQSITVNRSRKQERRSQRKITSKKR
ncbi:hypothetical protein HanIR_Chr10g0489151 [Helianthus annuus]|nr:hypothetical protein HanIR_Chr10g0489151 [Helianthus annuus]